MCLKNIESDRMKNLRKVYHISLILQNRVETGFAVKTKNFTGSRLNQEDERDTRLRKWLTFQRYILQNGQEAHQNRQQTKCKISVVVLTLKKTRASWISMLQRGLPL